LTTKGAVDRGGEDGQEFKLLDWWAS